MYIKRAEPWSVMGHGAARLLGLLDDGSSGGDLPCLSARSFGSLALPGISPTNHQSLLTSHRLRHRRGRRVFLLVKLF
jgi:hypothetical protein